jgi:iron complex transport system ATP-binding protein
VHHRPQARSTVRSQIVVEDLTFGYGDRPVLRGVSFSIEGGDFVGVVGPNGSGKSTLLRVLDALLKPQRGRVLLDGREVVGYPRRELARRVALVPQQFDLDFDFSALEVVEMGRYCRREGDSRTCARVALDALRAGHLADRLFPQLSGGEKQMVVLAQALAQEPDVLLLDEPVSALDVAHQIELFDRLQRLHADGLSVVCVLHDLNLALHYCGTLLMLSDGEVAAWGPAGEVLDPETIGAVYGVGAHLHRHAGRAFLTFSPRPRGQRRGRVHLVCGGGTGAALMRELAEMGYMISAGVVNALDADEVAGRDMGLEMVVEAPFCTFSDQAHRENLDLLAKADLVILTDVPVGRGNLRNLDAVRAARDRGATVWAVDGLAKRDFSGGVANLDLTGVRLFPGTSAMVEELRR